MKSRLGFVSNSSSSSFLFAADWAEKPDVWEVGKYLFPDGRGVSCSYYDEEVNALDAATSIHKHMEGPLSESEVLEIIRDGYFDGHPDWSTPKSDAYEKKFRQETGRAIRSEPEDSPSYKEFIRLMHEDFDDSDKEIDKAALEYYNKNKEAFNGKNIWYVSIGDNHGSIMNGAMEHGNTFRNVRHLVISNH